MDADLAAQLVAMTPGDVTAFCPVGQTATAYVVAYDEDAAGSAFTLHRGHDLDRPETWRPVRTVTNHSKPYAAAKVAAAMTLTWRTERHAPALPIDLPITA